MIPDSYITELRLKAVRELPWPIPAAVLVEMTDEDLDRLSAATNRDYWRVLNTIVTRISERRLTA
ncbi:MAG TPA: hypothetical protein VK357_06220 [Rubrobacteraceae bacterium]|nr:hypothetical protein [Rubrobacteraceae bacterium]